MADGSGGSGSGVPGAGGVQAPPGNLADGVGAAPAACTPGTVGCPLAKHWVRAELRYLDNGTPVGWAKGDILFGTMIYNPGPLYMGVLESKDVPAGTYSVIFPEIDANEWWEG